MVVTVDVPVVGAREKDLRNGLTVPPRDEPADRLGPRPAPPLAGRPARAPAGRRSPTSPGCCPTRAAPAGSPRTPCGLLNPGHTWRDLEWMIERFDGPVLLKGVMTGEDARRAVDVGCRAVAVSNHGGRQADAVPAAVDVLARGRRPRSAARPTSCSTAGSGAAATWSRHSRWGDGLPGRTAVGVRARRRWHRRCRPDAGDPARRDRPHPGAHRQARRGEPRPSASASDRSVVGVSTT